MSDISKSLTDIRALDALSRGDSGVHRLHPLAKMGAAAAFIACVASFGRHDVTALIPYIFYPLILFAVSKVKAGPILKRLLYVMPFILLLGIFSPLFENTMVSIGGTAFSAGWLTFLSITLKGCLSVTAALLLAATTGMERIAAGLRKLHVPRLFVLQLLLTARYTGVLMEEGGRMALAYHLRAPRQKGIHPRAWGPLAGMLLLRSHDRARRVHDAMSVRGFNGEYHTGMESKMKGKDWAFMLLCTGAFVAARIWDLSALAGNLLTGAGL